MTKPAILVIDDDPDFQGIATWMLEKHEYDVKCVSAPNELTSIGPFEPQVILLDWQLGELDGTTLIQSLRSKYANTPVIFVTAYSSPEVAATSIKLGAFDFLTKPLDEAKLIVSLAKAVEYHNLRIQLARLDDQQEAGFQEMVGTSPQMKTVYSIIRNVAPTDVSVMISGESGTGKELVASALHVCSDRSTGPFVPLNMASIPADLAESTLFGHEKGAFTGADRSLPGAVAEASGGTLFLDEITEMPLELQSKLLRFLQERRYRPVGGGADQKANVRIVSATNRAPEVAVSDKKLREDLYYRLNVIPIALPPLREREGDIGLIANHALQKFAKQYGKQFDSMTPHCLDLLQAYSWPGNVRELVHTMQRVVVLNEGPVLEAHMLPNEIASRQILETSNSPPEVTDSPPTVSSPEDSSAVDRRESIVSLDELEKQAIRHALEVCEGSAYEAARRLGLSAATIYRKIKLYDLGD